MSDTFTAPTNPYNSLIHSMIGLQLSSIGTQQEVSASNTMVTDANQKLSELWTSCPESFGGSGKKGSKGYEPPDPGYAAWKELQEATGAMPPPAPLQASPGKGYDPRTKTMRSTQHAVEGWISKNLGHGKSISEFSSAFITTVESAFAEYCSGAKGHETTDMALMSSTGNLISATASSDLQTGQTVISTLNNVSQHFESDQGPLSSASTTLLDAANNFASALQSIVA